MLKKNNVIVIANLQAFGVVCYSRQEKKILLIPKNKKSDSSEGKSNVKELLFTYLNMAGFYDDNQVTGALLYVLAVFFFLELVLTSETYVNMTIAYLVFLAASALSGIALGELLFGEIHRSLESFEYKEVEYIDQEIEKSLKKKLKKDIFIGTVVPIGILSSFIFLPLTLEHYLEVLPMSLSTFFLIDFSCFIVKGILTMSPPFLKLQAYQCITKLKRRA